MGKFYGYPLPGTLDGTEVVVIEQGDYTKSVELSTIVSDLGLATNLVSLSDTTISNEQDGQMLLYKIDTWVNGNDPLITNYTEGEYNIGTVSGTYDIDLTNGNIQRLVVGGALSVTLPVLPVAGRNWNLVLKVVYDGSNIPTFTSNDATIKWAADTVPDTLGENGSMNIYVFTSDTVASEIYSAKAWGEV